MFAVALVHNGYERGLTVRGAPYDFRYAPHSQAFYFVQLRQLVEETWAINGRRKVVLLAHSMGGLYAAYFLSRQPAAWKDRCVEALVSVNTPWAGQSPSIQRLMRTEQRRVESHAARPCLSKFSPKHNCWYYVIFRVCHTGLRVGKTFRGSHITTFCTTFIE